MQEVIKKGFSPLVVALVLSGCRSNAGSVEPLAPATRLARYEGPSVVAYRFPVRWIWSYYEVQFEECDYDTVTYDGACAVEGRPVVRLTLRSAGKVVNGSKVIVRFPGADWMRLPSICQEEFLEVHVRLGKNADIGPYVPAYVLRLPFDLAEERR